MGTGFRENIMRQSKGRALVIGGSMSGLLAGLTLRARGWDVDVFERVESELSGRGAGIVTDRHSGAHRGPSAHWGRRRTSDGRRTGPPSTSKCAYSVPMAKIANFVMSVSC